MEHDKIGWPGRFFEVGRYVMEGVPVSQVRHSFNGKRVFYNKRFTDKKKYVTQQIKIQKRVVIYPKINFDFLAKDFFTNKKIEAGVPLKIVLLYIFPRPKRLKRKKDPANYIAHVSKPDVDNLDKFYLDCLSGIAFEDDNQIFNIESIKLYSSYDYESKTEGWVGTIAHIFKPDHEVYFKNPDELPW